MLIALCCVAFAIGWYLSAYYLEQKREEEYLRKTKQIAENIAESSRKAEYLDYVWRSYE